MRAGWKISNPSFFLILLGLVGAALALRLWGIDIRGITHPEVYVPGIPLPEGISEPPPRHEFWSALWWHYHYEPHPIGWYMAMFGWTELFGTTHTAIRLPAALFGAASVAMIAVIGRLVWNREAGLLAGAMTMLHGYQLFMGQQARMYMPGLFLGLLSTWLLLKLMSEDRRRPGMELAYLLTIVAGTETIEFFWPFLAMQLAWVSLVSPGFGWQGWGRALRLSFAGSPRVLQIQTLAIMLSVPSLTHSLYQARNGATRPPNAEFALEYLNFGFLYLRDYFSVPTVGLSLVVSAILGAICLACAFAGLRRASVPDIAQTPSFEPLPRWLPWVLAALCSAFAIWLGTIAHVRSFPLTLFGISPLLALAIPAVSGAIRGLLQAVFPPVWPGKPPAPLLFGLYAIVMPAMLFSASFLVSVSAHRAFLVFTPYLLLLAAAGILALAGRFGAYVKAGAAMIVILVFAISVPHSYHRLSSPRDYQGIADALHARMQPTDMVLLRDRRWDDTPIFYYLPDIRYIVKDWTAALDADPGARAWLVTWPDEDHAYDSGPRHDALAGYESVDVIEGLRARAELFVRSPES